MSEVVATLRELEAPRPCPDCGRLIPLEGKYERACVECQLFQCIRCQRWCDWQCGCGGESEIDSSTCDDCWRERRPEGDDYG